MKDYYYILGLESDAKIQEIKKAYRKLSKKFHPDVNQGDIFFEKRFKEINEAYEVLSNPISKNEFDRKRKKKYENKSSFKEKPHIVFFKTTKTIYEVNEEVSFTWRAENANICNVNLFGNVKSKGEKTIKFKKEIENLTVVLFAKSAEGEAKKEVLISVILPPQNNDKQKENNSSYQSDFQSSNQNQRSNKSLYFIIVLLLSILTIASFWWFDQENPKTIQTLKDKDISQHITENYSQELYDWIVSQDDTFEEREPFEQWQKKVSEDAKYQDDLYKWISSVDNTFEEREPFEQWSQKVKNKDEPASTSQEEGTQVEEKPGFIPNNIKLGIKQIERYYKSFENVETLSAKVQSFYNPIIMDYHGRTFVTSLEAKKRDVYDFLSNDIQSYYIKVDDSILSYDEFEYYYLIQTDLNYIITKNNGNTIEKKFEINIALTKDDYKILAISNELNPSKISNLISKRVEKDNRNIYLDGIILKQIEDYYLKQHDEDYYRVVVSDNDTEKEITFYNRPGNGDDYEGFLLSVTIPKIKKYRTVFGDLNNDTIDDLIISVHTAGGWAGRNVEWNDHFVFLRNKNNFELIAQHSDAEISGCKSGRWGGGFSIQEIKNNKVIGTSTCYSVDDLHCCPSLEYWTTMSLVEGKLQVYDQNEIKK